MSTEPVAPHRSEAVPADYDEISLWEVLAVLVRRRWTIVWTTVVTMALAVAAAFVPAPSFTTTALFRPQGADASSGQLMALASQFGVNVGNRAEGASPAFYAELLNSREILHRLAIGAYDVDGVGRTSLADLLEIEEDTEELRTEEVIEWLREDAVSVSTAVETGTVGIGVETEWPDLSREIAERLIAEITSFNMNTRQSQAAEERRFIAARVDSARVELLEAEEELQRFMESNRSWQGAPLLQFQQERLQREVTLKSSVLTTLVQSFEQARIAEVRDTPVITVLQAPYLPPGPDDRPLVIALALGVVLGVVFGMVLAFLVEAFRRPAEGDPAREDFRKTWDSFVGSLPLVGRRA